jgi:hypothetical protein
VPTDEGQRNRRLFSLARALKGKFPDSGAEAMRPIVVRWHTLALPRITTKDFGTSWDEFIYAWGRVRCLEGDGSAPIERILARADTSKLPTVAGKYESEVIRRLVKFSRELQREAGDDPFWISNDMLGRLFQIKPMIAWRALQRLCDDGVLTKVEKHTTNRATRYRYNKGV